MHIYTHREIERSEREKVGYEIGAEFPSFIYTI